MNPSIFGGTTGGPIDSLGVCGPKILGGTARKTPDASCDRRPPIAAKSGNWCAPEPPPRSALIQAPGERRQSRRAWGCGPAIRPAHDWGGYPSKITRSGDDQNLSEGRKINAYVGAITGMRVASGEPTSTFVSLVVKRAAEPIFPRRFALHALTVDFHVASGSVERDENRAASGWQIFPI